MYESPSLHRFIKSPSAASQTFAVPRLASRLVHYNYNGTRLGLGGGDPGAVELPWGQLQAGLGTANTVRALGLRDNAVGKRIKFFQLFLVHLLGVKIRRRAARHVGREDPGGDTNTTKQKEKDEPRGQQHKSSPSV